MRRSGYEGNDSGYVPTDCVRYIVTPGQKGEILARFDSDELRFGF
jgi:hypothetical protein